MAKLAGVAPITVSRAINDPPASPPPLRKQIDEAIEALGYVRNQFAGALASAESRIVPVIVPSLSNAVFIEVIQGIQEILGEARYQLLSATPSTTSSARPISLPPCWAGRPPASSSRACVTRRAPRSCSPPPPTRSSRSWSMAPAPSI